MEEAVLSGVEQQGSRAQTPPLTPPPDSCGQLALDAHNYRDLITKSPYEAIRQNIASSAKTQSCKTPESRTLSGETVEVIKVFLEPRRQDQSVTMLTDEVSQIQEVRYCLKSLREQMAARHKNSNQFPLNGIRVSVPNRGPPVSESSVDGTTSECQEHECLRMKELTRDLSTQLQEQETRHQEEIEALQAENRECLQRLEELNKHIQLSQSEVEGPNQQIEELQRLLGELQLKNASLHEENAAGEAELQELRTLKNGELENRCKQLENELAIQKEKNHQLDDMLKSQQRKVRNMIEQLQNSRTMMADRERLIADLHEKVSFLEAENREMRDQVEYCLGERHPEKEAQIVYSKPLTPTNHGNKTLPFIKVIEMKS